MSTATAMQQNQNHAQAGMIDPLTVTDICNRIRSTCKQAVDSGDSLSFATILELYIGDPYQFNNEEGSAILETLYGALSENPSILYEVGWDIPELLLRYVDRFFDADLTHLPAQKPFRLVMSLFSLICEKGNPRELFVRACELILSTESEQNSIRLQAMSLNSSGDEDGSGSNSKGIQIDMAADNFESLDDTKQENVKFCTLFEVMRYSLQNIDTAHPSGYLLEAARTLLQAANDLNADLLSVTTYARRMYLLARDFTISHEEKVSHEELVQVQKILVNFISHSVDVLLRKYPLKLSERLYVQMKNRVAMAPPTDRTFVYKESDYTHRISEAISRMSQLILSYDFDPDEQVKRLLGIDCDYASGALVFSKVQPPVSQVTDWNHEEDNYWSKELLKGPSLAGLLIIKTNFHFDGSREKKPNWKTSAKFASVVISQCPMSAGLKDMLLYWALWISNHNESFVFDDDALLTEYLNSILQVICTSPSPQEKYVTGSIVARFLRFQSHAFSYNFCINIMKHSNSPYQHFVVVESLKMLITGKIVGYMYNNNNNNSNSSPESPPNPAPVDMINGRLTLNDDQKLEISRVSQHAIARLFAETATVPCYYLNFLMVVPTVPHVVLEICDELDTITQTCRSSHSLSDGCRVQVQLLLNAVSHLRTRAQEMISGQN